MANEYSLLLKSKIQVDIDNLEATKKQLQEYLKIQMQIDVSNLDKLPGEIRKRFEQIKETTDQLANIKIGENKNGVINSVQLQYMDEANRKLTEYYTLEQKVNETTGATESVWTKRAVANDNILKTSQQLEKVDAQIVANKEKEAAINERIQIQNDKSAEKYVQSAKEFLAKSQNMTGAGVLPAQDLAKQIVQLGQVREAAVKAGTGTAQYDTQLKQMNADLRVAQAGLSGASGGLKDWGSQLQQAIKTTITYTFTTGLMYAALSQLKDGVQYIKDLNKEMVSIQMVTGQTKEQIDGMALSYNKLAKAMSVTTMEVASGSLEFIRQGKSAEETGILIKNSLMLAKLGNMETADSSDRLTSIMNGFKMKAEETGVVVDKLTGLDNAFATSVNEISTAMKYGSNVAGQVGVDFDHLAAYITVISSTTRQSAEMIGQALSH